MNVLSSILPGVREIRTPLSVGMLWLVTVLLLGAPSWDRLRDNRAVELARELSNGLPSAWVLGGLAFAAYLVGNVALPIQAYVLHRLREGARLVSRGLWRRHWRGRGPGRLVIRSLNRLQATFDDGPHLARSPLLNAVGQAYARAEAPPDAQFDFPVDDLLDRLDSASMQLAQSAPAQAQEYDRLRAEAEFRTGIVPPLTVVLAVTSWYVGWPWAFWPLLVGVLLVALVLLGQAHRLGRRTQLLAANSVYHGYIKLPVLDNLADELLRADLSANDALGAWAGASVIALKRLGEPWLASSALHAYRPSDPTDAEALVEFLRRHDTAEAERARARFSAPELD